jgi:uncharacterized phage protein (TIGR02216 family)
VKSTERVTFAENARRLCGYAAMLLAWRPDEFWSATPAELACILEAMKPQEAAPLDSAAIHKLQEQFPDG